MSLGEPGERLRSGYCNLYQQGWYHRAGKATTMCAHPGDMYPTREAAIADIDPKAAHLYIATALIQWEQPEGTPELHVYPDGSQPVPLSETRKLLTPQAEVLVGLDNPGLDPYRLAQERLIRETGMDPMLESLDTSESEALELAPAPSSWKVGAQWQREADAIANWPSEGAP